MGTPIGGGPAQGPTTLEPSRNDVGEVVAHRSCILDRRALPARTIGGNARREQRRRTARPHDAPRRRSRETLMIEMAAGRADE